MGQEAECACEWNGNTARVKALLEPPELILRGGMRRRIRFAEMREVRADGDALRFVFEEDPVALATGSALAEKWVKSILAPPPSLAKKLGIRDQIVVRTIGKMDDDALRQALAAAKRTSRTAGDLILARVNTPADLARALDAAAGQLVGGTPIWLIYPKGRGHALSESEVRGTALAAGIVDTKVTAVSAVLTGLRFVKRRS
jgi:hypothetical protein